MSDMEIALSSLKRKKEEVSEQIATLKVDADKLRGILSQLERLNEQDMALANAINNAVQSMEYGEEAKNLSEGKPGVILQDTWGGISVK